ncbi:MAG: UvrD-helicase domain-containing protein [Patescibacteria group bacterium]
MTKPSNLNERQQEAVNHKNGPLLIAAGAGSGKTKTLTSRLAALIADGIKPENIIAITFTNKAAEEMRNRTSRIFNAPSDKDKNIQHVTLNNALFVGTFHSLGARILKKEAKLVGRNSNFTIFDEDDALSLLKKVLKNLNLSKDQQNPLAARARISDVKNELIKPEEYLNPRELKIFEEYEQALLRNNAFDFDDLIEKVVAIFSKNPTVLEKYQNQFQYILVDEYQDVNPSQYQLVRLLAQKNRNISVVGDDAQSIYAFRGSDFRNFLNFEKDWPNAKVVLLEQNYRSTSNIITAASALIKNNKSQKPKELWTENTSGDLIKVAACEDAETEADFIAEQITSSLHQGKAPRNNKESVIASASEAISNTAILYRTNAQSRAIEQALIVADIPYKIFGGLKFYERKEVKDVVAALRIANNPKDEISAERLIKNFRKAETERLLGELPRLGKTLKILELINFFLTETRYFDFLEKNFPNSKERIENINELIVFASGFENLSEFLERVSLLQSADRPAKNTVIASASEAISRGSPRSARDDGFAVNLMTIHLAKGLEFDNVFVAGCNEGILPHQMSYGSMNDTEEERRLMYVAMTRARKNLYLSFYNLPSRFLGEIPPELPEVTQLGSPQYQEPEEDIYTENEDYA